MKNEERVYELLKQKGLRISFAESCTAGLAAARMVNNPGASSVFDLSFVTYANQAKIDQVHVSPDFLAAFGAVSETVAAEMAQGCAQEANAEIGVGISGIAGPEGGTAEKPVGTVCFGFRTPAETISETMHFGNLGRENVRAAAVEHVYERLISLLEEL